MDRIDMAHAKYHLLLEHRRFLAPISASPQEILDMGTGSGIWSIDISEEYPAANVTGVDIAPTQPSFVPPNCSFEVDDLESEWTFNRNSFDFIFARDLIFAIRDWPKLVGQCFDHLKPGGWLELESIYGVLNCDDGSLPEDGSFRQFDKLVQEAAVGFKTPLTDPGEWKKQLEDAGFVDVVEARFKIPCSPWPKDKRMKIVGAFERENFLEGLEGMSLRLFQRSLGWTPEETQVLLAKVREEIKNPRYHPYYPLYVGPSNLVIEDCSLTIHRPATWYMVESRPELQKIGPARTFRLCTSQNPVFSFCNLSHIGSLFE